MEYSGKTISALSANLGIAGYSTFCLVAAGVLVTIGFNADSDREWSLLDKTGVSDRFSWVLLSTTLLGVVTSLLPSVKIDGSLPET